MVKVVAAYIIDAEIIKNEYKHNGASFVAPKAGHGGGLVLACLIEAHKE